MNDAAHTRVIVGDCREVLRTLPDESVHCVVTSPPYWGLRDYGVEGGIGLEESVTEHLAALVGVFAEVRRVLRKDGTLWINYGDAYAGSWGAQSRDGKANVSALSGEQVAAAPKRTGTGSMARTPDCKPKDLIGLPWALAFALRADGWYLRQDIIWSKPNPMPESVTDRCTKAHEYLFLLSKSDRYFYDQEAILEPCSPTTHARLSQDLQNQVGSDRAHAGGKTNGNMKAVSRAIKMDESEDRRKVGFNQRWAAGEAKPRKVAATGSGAKNNESFDAAMAIMPTMRNKRSVWTVATQPFKGAHFATFPPALIEPCIMAGCPKGGTVLDPFGGAGTTGLVASRLQRSAILIELNPTYAALARERIANDAPLFSQAAE